VVDGRLEAEAILAEKNARDEFCNAKTCRASAEETGQKRDAWIKASENRKKLAVNVRGERLL